MHSYQHLLAEPLRLDSVELLRHPSADVWITRVRSGGLCGFSMANQHAQVVAPMFNLRVAPVFLGADVRDLWTLVERVYVTGGNYKLAGISLWTCVGYIETAAIDLLGRATARYAAELLGGVARKEVPVYLSSLRRDTTPEAEVDRLEQRVASTGARAVKIKIGGRMSAGVDASPGRSQRLIELIRRRMGDAMVIYADANGSYNARQAIEVGRMLEDHGVALFEEPCPWEEYDQTRAVAQALGINVGGGEQDSSWPRWREMIDNRIVDVAQPDVLYNGGLLRTRRVTDHAASAGLTATPHSPKTGPWAAAMLALVSSLRNPNDYHEWRDSDDPWPAWCSPACGVKGGSVTVPSGAGLGVDYDPQFVAQMRVV